MCEFSVAAKAVLVGEQAINIISYLMRRNTAHLDIGSSTHDVLGFCATPDSLIMSLAPRPAINTNWGAIVVADDLKYFDQL